MQNRKMRYILATAMLLALPVVASAQTSRVEGLNVPGDYIKDYTAIYGWPASVNTVGNLIYGELGNIDFNSTTGNPTTLDRGMGAVLTNLWDGRFGTWAIHLREQRPALGQGDNMGQPNPGSGADPNENAQESFDIMWGKKFGTTSFGLRLNRSFGSFKNEVTGVTTEIEFDGFPGDPNLRRNVMGFGAGLGFEMSPSTDAEVSILYESRTWQNRTETTGGTTVTEDDGPTTFMLAGRMMWKWQPDVLVVPVVKWYQMDLSERAQAGTATASWENKFKGWQAGVAGNWALNQNDLFVLGFAFAQNKLNQQEDLFNISGLVPVGLVSDTLEATETIMPHVFAGLETHVNSWLTLRFGATKGMFTTYKIKSEGSQDQTVTAKGSPFSFNLGSGVKLGNLQLDAILDTAFPFNPFAQLVGGDQSFSATSSPFTKVTATYAF